MDRMGGARRFENLIAWQKARELVRSVYGVIREAPFAADFRMVSQSQSAAVSVMSNIAAGFERDSPAELQQFLKIAKGSCGETRSLLFVALDNGLLALPTFDHLQGRTQEVSRIVAGLRASVVRRRINAARPRPKR